MRFKDLSGQKFGRLIALSLANPPRYKNNTYWDCRCDCGKLCTIRQGHLIDGSTSSCGCLRKEWERENNPKICFLDFEAEAEVEKLLVRGLSNKAIAELLGISRNTVKRIKSKYQSGSPFFQSSTKINQVL